MESLEEIGDKVALRLQGLEDERGRMALAAWNERGNVPVEAIASVGTGLSDRMLEAVACGDIEGTFEIEAGELEPTELLAVTRMAAPLIREPGVLRFVLRHMRVLPRRTTAALDNLSDETHAARSEWISDRAFTEGYRLAEWLRRRLALEPDAPVDPGTLLRRWNVVVRSEDFKIPDIDAIACWGPRHGPAILLNSSMRYRSKARRRATLAHEIGHLLIDRRDALPVSEVLGGQAPLTPERRARAFAAEFLLPRTVAGEAFASAGDPALVLRRLCDRFEVSKEITAWQALNSDLDMSGRVRTYLRQYTHPQLGHPLLSP
jgi:Zn-dependent peptidase ImmA (M78 family)